MNTIVNTTDQELQEYFEARKLFTHLVTLFQKSSSSYWFIDAGENMGILCDMIYDDWTQRYLLDFTAQCAYEVIGPDRCFCHITEDDIEWSTLKGVSEKALARAHHLYTRFPTRIGKFENGVAQVDWQINPDGMYYMDSDGFGMTDDVETELNGFIDRRGRVVVKFRYVNDDWKLLKQMRKEAEQVLAEQ